MVAAAVIAVVGTIISKGGTLPDSTTTITVESKITIKQAAELSFHAAFPAFPLDLDT
jgi:hypothetical protein